jgi:hypothetical protein
MMAAGAAMRRAARSEAVMQMANAQPTEVADAAMSQDV